MLSILTAKHRKPFRIILLPPRPCASPLESHSYEIIGVPYCFGKICDLAGEGKNDAKSFVALLLPHFFPVSPLLHYSYKKMGGYLGYVARVPPNAGHLIARRPRVQGNPRHMRLKRERRGLRPAHQRRQSQLTWPEAASTIFKRSTSSLSDEAQGRVKSFIAPMKGNNTNSHVTGLLHEMTEPCHR
jgi:hypothetical protein